MKFGQFYPANSLIHKLDPRLKIFLMILVSTEIFFVSDTSSYFLIMLSVFFCVKLSKIPLHLFLRSMKKINSIVILTAALNIFFITDGNVVMHLFFIRITDYALALTFQMILRLIILVSICALVMYSTSPLQLTNAIINILSPFKKILPVSEIAMIISIALRFIPVLSDEFNLLMKAQTSRGINFNDKNFITRAKNYLALMVPIFILSFKRADDLALAMEARCYNPNAKRNSLNKLRFQPLDFYVIIFMCVIHFVLYWL